MSDSPAVGRLRSRLAALSAISKTIANTLDLDDLFRIIYHETARVLDATIFLLGIYDPKTQTVEVVRQVDSGEELPGGSFPLGSGFTSQVIRTQQPLLIRHWSRHGPRVQMQYATDHQGLPESAVIVPVLSGERVVGVLSLQSYETNAYDDDDLLTLQAIAGQAAVAIENLRRSERLDLQLQRRISELEAILASMADALLIVDATGAIVRLNHAARALLCTDGATVVLGQPLSREQWGQWPIGPRAVAEALSAIIDQLRRGEGPREVEVEVSGAGVRRQVLSFSCAPLYDLDRAFGGGVIVFRDVTDRREVERLKDEMLSVASHDLKTPVTIIKGQAQLLWRKLSSGKPPPESLFKGLTAIDGQADRLVRLLDLLLDLSRIETGRFELDCQVVDMTAVAAAIAEGIQPLTDKHRIVLRTPPSVDGYWDRARIEQVFQNLLTNAVKYSPAGGDVEVWIEPDDGQVTVRVRDNGLGIPPDELPHLFERFYRAPGTRRLEGTGLGLYICRGIVEAHGGRIWAESDGAGNGSTFTFVLPRKAAGTTTGTAAGMAGWGNA